MVTMWMSHEAVARRHREGMRERNDEPAPLFRTNFRIYRSAFQPGLPSAADRATWRDKALALLETVGLAGAE